MSNISIDISTHVLGKMSVKYPWSVGEMSVDHPLALYQPTCLHNLYRSLYNQTSIMTLFASRSSIIVEYCSSVNHVTTNILTNTSADMSIKVPHKIHDPSSLPLLWLFEICLTFLYFYQYWQWFPSVLKYSRTSIIWTRRDLSKKSG